MLDEIPEHRSIIDLGTGSGCIAIALAKNLTNPIFAIDVSTTALSLAKENAKLNDVKVDFRHFRYEPIRGNLTSNLK